MVRTSDIATAVSNQPTMTPKICFRPNPLTGFLGPTLTVFPKYQCLVNSPFTASICSFTSLPAEDSGCFAD